jgi:oligosaccharide repeat unit polymerase
MASAVFTGSSFMLALNSSWNYQISFGTYMFITSAVVIFSLGAIIGKSFQNEIRTKKTLAEHSNHRYNSAWDEVSRFTISGLAMFLISFLCMLVTGFYLLHQYRLSLTLGNTSGIMGVVGAIRSVVQTNQDVFQLSMLLNIGISFTRAAGFICEFLIIVNLFNKQKKIYKYIIPLICLLLNTILATGRGALISIVTAGIFDIYIIRRLKGDRSINRKIIKYIVIGFLLFTAAFRVLGTLTGKSAILSAWDTISIYTGSSVLCLDSLLKNGWELSAFFGRHTFTGIYNILRSLGFSLPYLSNHAEMVRWSHFSSNVYTSFYPYLLDFGVMATLVLQVVISIIFGMVWNKYNKGKCSYLLLITFGRFWGSALVYYSIAERLGSSYLALNAFTEIFFYILLIRLFLKRVKSTSGKAVPVNKILIKGYRKI